jgi:hypothetical protein
VAVEKSIMATTLREVVLPLEKRVFLVNPIGETLHFFQCDILIVGKR